MNKLLRVLSITAAVGLSMTGCGNAGQSGVGDGGDASTGGSNQDLATIIPDLAGTATITIDDIQTQVFTPKCGGKVQFTYCHVSEPPVMGSPGAGLDLSAGKSLAALVNQPAAFDAPSKILVVPGDPAKSFLWQKLNGLQGPKEGKSMPWGEAINIKLSQDLLDLVNHWIIEGAH